MNKDNGVENSTGQPYEKSVNKIIKLQTSGTRRVQMKIDTTEKKAALMASILSIIAVVTFLNQKILSQFEIPSQRNVRGIASINDQAEYGFQWQRDLAKELSSKTKRSIASYGEAPSKLDQVRFGLLEGKYAFVFDDQKEVLEIRFNDALAGEKPKFIKNYQAFLLDNKDILMPELASLKVSQIETRNSEKEQFMEALDESNQVIGKVSVVTDLSGRFLSMKFTKSN